VQRSVTDGVPKQVLVAASFSFWDWYQGKSSDWSSHSTTCLGRSFGKVADRGLDLGMPNLSSFTASAFPLLITLHSVCREVIPIVSMFCGSPLLFLLSNRQRRL
jgi:hypothetical protein